MSSQATAPAARPPKDDIGLRIAHWCSVVYIFFYAVELPICYVLHLAHLGQIIVIRDGLIAVPLLVLGVRGILQHRLHPAFWVFGCVAAIAGTVSALHFGTPLPALVGTKILLNVLFGVVAGSMLVFLPSKRLCQCMIALWVITVLALVAEKYFISFPWIGMRETIGGVEVEIARDWQVADPGSKRVGGLTRSSIEAAVLVCGLCITIMFQFRHTLFRIGMTVVTAGAVYLTTQKGAVIGFVLVSLAACTPRNMRRPRSRSFSSPPSCSTSACRSTPMDYSWNRARAAYSAADRSPAGSSKPGPGASRGSISMRRFRWGSAWAGSAPRSSLSTTQPSTCRTICSC